MHMHKMVNRILLGSSLRDSMVLHHYKMNPKPIQVGWPVYLRPRHKQRVTAQNQGLMVIKKRENTLHCWELTVHIVWFRFGSQVAEGLIGALFGVGNVHRLSQVEFQMTKLFLMLHCLSYSDINCI